MSNNRNMPLKVAAYLKGVGITKVTLDEQNNLVFTLSNGKVENVGALNVDTSLNSESKNPVQNKALYAALRELEGYVNAKDNEGVLRDQNNKAELQEAIGRVNSALASHKAEYDNFFALANAQLARVESGSVVTDNTSQKVIRGDNKPASGDAIYAALRGKVDKVDGKGLSTNDYTNADKAQVAENKANIATKQDKLSVSLKGNGNIVINNLEGGAKEFMPATPSGDPMHYAYEAAGATWSSATGFWSLNTLTDITTEQMRKIYNMGFLHIPSTMLGGSEMSDIRTNLGRTGKLNYTQASLNILAFAYGNKIIEVINLATRIANNGDQNSAGIVSINGMNTAFYGCEKLRMIYGRMSIAKVDAYYTQNAFYGCTALEEVRIDTLTSLSFADSPNLSKASILYLVQNSKPTTAITITLHPTAYAMAKADSDIQSALASKPNITLISA